MEAENTTHLSPPPTHQDTFMNKMDSLVSDGSQSETAVEILSNKDKTENIETFGISDYPEDTFAGPSTASCATPCPLCGEDPTLKTPQLLSCLHSVCLDCTKGQEIITCNRCRQETMVPSMVPDFVHLKQGNTETTVEKVELEGKLLSLVSRARARIAQLPGEVSGLSNTLGDLQEVRDNSRGLVEETYQSYRAILEESKNAALLELEERHNQRELAIMEKLEHYDLTESCLDQSITFAEQLLGSSCSDGERQKMDEMVEARLTSLLEQLDRKPAGLQTSLVWKTDKEAFSAAVRENFGKFSSPSAQCVQPSCAGDGSPTLVVSAAADSSQAALVQALLTPGPTLGQVTTTPTPGLLSLGPLSPLSPASPSLSLPLCSPQGLAPQQRPRSGHGHGPIGSSVSSPAHQYSLTARNHLGLSHPDLTQHSPRHSLGLTQHTPTPPLPHTTNVEYNLAAQLANISMERSTSGPVNTNPSFTLADLISNVEEDTVPPLTPSWDPSDPSPHPPHHQHQALNNLAALAKLDEYNEGSARTCNNTWPPPDPTLLLPDLNRDQSTILTRSLSNLGSDASPGNHSMVSPGNHSLSPVLGLTVPHMGGRGTSPISPIDNLMPQLGGLSISPVPGNVLTQPILRSGINMSSVVNQSASAQPRSLNSMQIRCKFGQLGPGKGQFNSPHGFCLGLEEEIIVADTNNHRIQVFEKNGTYRYQFGIPGKEEGQLWYPRKVAVMKNSGKFVVCDRGNERSRMQIFTKHGHFVRKIAIRYIDIVAGLAITRDGNIVAVDSVTPTMFVISEQGELLRWFDCADYMREPSDIAVGGREFYVCDFKGHNVVVFTEDGVFVRRIGCENITNFPNGIDISDAGDILIGDSHGNRFHVAVFANDGGLLAEFECPHVKVSRCCGLKITSEGYVVTLAKNNHHVLVLNTLYIA